MRLDVRDYGTPPRGDAKLPRSWECTECRQPFWPAEATNRGYTNHYEDKTPPEVEVEYAEHDCGANLRWADFDKNRRRKARKLSHV